jgi:hypothetical protein
MLLPLIMVQFLTLRARGTTFARMSATKLLMKVFKNSKILSRKWSSTRFLWRKMNSERAMKKPKK